MSDNIAKNTEYPRNAGTIVLKDEDSINFARHIFRPTKEELEKNARIMQGIRRDIHIRKDSRRIIAEVDSLDLSFLHKSQTQDEES